MLCIYQILFKRSLPGHTRPPHSDPLLRSHQGKNGALCGHSVARLGSGLQTSQLTGTHSSLSMLTSGATCYCHKIKEPPSHHLEEPKNPQGNVS